MEYQFEVLGIKDVNFKDDSGKLVSGVQLWVVGETGDAAWMKGVEVVKLWIPDGHPLEAVGGRLNLHDQIKVTFDRRGKPFAIEVI